MNTHRNSDTLLPILTGDEKWLGKVLTSMVFRLSTRKQCFYRSVSSDYRISIRIGFFSHSKSSTLQKKYNTRRMLYIDLVCKRLSKALTISNTTGKMQPA